MKHATRLALAAVLLGGLSCGEPLVPGDPPDDPQLMTILGCELDPECDPGGGGGGGSGGTGDPDPGAPGYWLGSTVTPDVCFSATGAGINDVDQDGMHDYCEEQLARVFAPSLVFSQYDWWTGREPYWAAKYFPAHQNEVRIMYLLSYYGDNGVVAPALWQSVGCPGVQYLGMLLEFWEGIPHYDPVLPTWVQENQPFHVPAENACEGHHGDSEFVVVDLVYSSITQHWMLQRVYFSAHYGTGNDRSQRVDYRHVEFPDKYRGYPRVWVAESKHANYPTRNSCQSWGVVSFPDDCQANSVENAVRVRYSPYYNIGSRAVNLVNRAESPGSCVRSTSPYRSGIECFWWRGYEFFGWLYDWGENRPAGDGASSYAPFLATQFECHSFSVRDGILTCSDWGVEAELF